MGAIYIYLLYIYIPIYTTYIYILVLNILFHFHPQYIEQLEAKDVEDVGIGGRLDEGRHCGEGRDNQDQPPKAPSVFGLKQEKKTMKASRNVEKLHWDQTSIIQPN